MTIYEQRKMELQYLLLHRIITHCEKLMDPLDKKVGRMWDKERREEEEWRKASGLVESKEEEKQRKAYEEARADANGRELDKVTPLITQALQEALNNVGERQYGY